MPLALTLGRQRLLAKCVQVIDTFDPKKTTVDAYVEDAEILKDKSVGDIEHKFIHQVFYGCVRYQKFLKLFVTSFLYKCPATAVRSDQTLYMVLGYLLFFRLEELGVAEYRQLLTSGAGTWTALFALLQYALDVSEIERWVKVEWCKVYDCRYVEEEIIGKLQRFADELRPVLEEVEFKATGKVADADAAGASAREKRRIVPEPFNLTKPKPRLVPEPEVISREVKALPLPPASTSLAAVEEQKRKRLEEQKAKVAAKYTPEGEFKLETMQRRDGSEVEELARKVDADRMAECTFRPRIGRYVPPTEEAAVRQNVAAVLREDTLIRQKQAQEYEVLKRYESELHDASEFHRWQDKMKQQDHLEEEKRVHKRMVEMQLAREGAVEAFESQVRRKGILAAHQREELAVDMELKAAEAEQELESKKVIVKETIGDREKARLAEEKEAKARAEKAEQVRREIEAEQERKRREDEQEMERRKDLIRQIRALEKVPVERFKQFDPAEAPCQGLLEEMSHAELWERLKSIEAQRAREREEKKERQLEKKHEKQKEITEKAENLAKVRDRAKDESKQRHEAIRKKKQEDERAQQAYKDQCVVEVAERLQRKKQQKMEEEQRLRKELKEISMKRQFLAANAEMVEAKAHAEQHSGLDREAVARQRGVLIEQHKKNQIIRKDDKIRRVNTQAKQEDLQAMRDAVDERLRKAKAADSALKDDILRANVTARNSQKSLERKLRDEFGHSSNKYMLSRMAKSA